jgi:hypothetical protein
MTSLRLPMTLNTKTRRVLAVMAVTTALCADQVAVAAPAVRPQRVEIGQMASRLVGRLTRSLRQGMPDAIVQPARQQRPAARPMQQAAAATPLSVGHAPGCPFQFRLPPPVL